MPFRSLREVGAGHVGWRLLCKSKGSSKVVWLWLGLTRWMQTSWQNRPDSLAEKGYNKKPGVPRVDHLQRLVAIPTMPRILTGKKKGIPLGTLGSNYLTIRFPLSVLSLLVEMFNLFDPRAWS